MMTMRYQVTLCTTAHMVDSLVSARAAHETPCSVGCSVTKHTVAELRSRGGKLVWDAIDPRAQSIWQEVIKDMEARETKGLERYGRYLTPDSKEMGLREAYEEALDLCVYLRKALIEMEGK